MTYIASEQGVVTGYPVELYDFVMSTTHYRYTSAGSDIEYLGSTYQAIPLHRSNVVDTGNADRGELTIELPRDNDLAALYIAGPAEYEVFLTAYRGHGSDYVEYWMGRVAAVRFKTDRSVIVAHPFATDADAPGLRRCYSIQCPYPLYGTGCGVIDYLYVITGTVQIVSGLTVVSPIFATVADNWLKGGKLYSNLCTRMITSHTGNTITLTSSIPGLVAGATLWAYAGCDKAMATCSGKFNNLLNYGGQPWLPDRNPFDGGVV